MSGEMNQHPRAKKLGVTAGPWTKQKDYSSVYSPNGLLIEGNYNEPDLQLCADAGNVMNQTGRTPSELVELVRELRECLMDVGRNVEYGKEQSIIVYGGSIMPDMTYSKSLLEKTKDFA